MNQNSGKLLIGGMLLAGLLAAGASWWFRFNATHRAAEFWGPQATLLIRDAPLVEVIHLAAVGSPSGEQDSGSSGGAGDIIRVGDRSWRVTSVRDVSHAPGLTHLRNALLEDNSFIWPARAAARTVVWNAGLRFRSGPQSTPLCVLISSDDRLLLPHLPGMTNVDAASCEPIAAGLREVLTEWTDAELPKR